MRVNISIKRWVVILTLLVAVDFGSRFIGPPRVLAQGVATPYWFVVNGVHTACVAATGTGVSTFCFAGDGEWESDAGGAWVQIKPGGGGGGVTSVFGRKGDVVAANGDYTYPQIGGVIPVPPAFGCTQFSLNNSSTPPMVANGCK